MNKNIKIKALVTGGAGFIGSHVAEELLRLQAQVIVLDDLSGGFKENVPSGAKFIRGSINDVNLIKKIFKQYKFDYIYHLAAYASEGLSFFIKKFNYENNLIGSVNLINASVNHGIKCFVFTSSIAVYGAQKPPFNEDTPSHPEDPYGVAKFAVEKDLKITQAMWGLPYIIFRPHNVYGERQNIGDKYRNVIGIFMNQIMQGKELTIFGNGKQTRAFSYIGDVAPIIARSAFHKKAYNQIFNIGADKEYSVNELAKEVKRAMSADNKIKYLPPRLEAENAYSIHDKVKKAFKYEPQTSLTKGIRLMARWAKNAGSKKSQGFSNIEVLKKLPPSWQIRNGKRKR